MREKALAPFGIRLLTASRRRQRRVLSAEAEARASNDDAALGGEQQPRADGVRARQAPRPVFPGEPLPDEQVFERAWKAGYKAGEALGYRRGVRETERYHGLSERAEITD